MAAPGGLGGGGGGSSSAEGSAGSEESRLWELVAGGWRLLEEVEGSAEASSGAPAVQSQVQRGLALLERAARALAQLDLFSREESVEEVASADLRFLLVPALLGALVLRQVAPERRLDHLHRARDAFMDFLRLCRGYGLAPRTLPPELPPPHQHQEEEEEEDQEDHHHHHHHPPWEEDRGGGGRGGGPSALVAMAAARQAKIERYKQKKEMENRLTSLKTFIESGQAEEEQIREYYLLQITKWVNVSLEEIESIDQEIAILSRRDALKQGSATRRLLAPRPPMKPFILTRDAAQAKVFGAGYPSLATMSVDDWYEQHRKRGLLPDQGVSRAATAGTEEQQKNPEEGQVEEEEESVRKAREWDDWKDMHPRGYGNRKNMG